RPSQRPRTRRCGTRRPSSVSSFLSVLRTHTRACSPGSASCQLFAPRRGVIIGAEKPARRTPARRYTLLKAQQWSYSPCEEGVRHGERYHDDYEPCQSVCLGGVSQTALFLCPPAGTGPDPATSG